MYQIRQISERAVSIIYPEEISPAVHQKVMSAALQFQGRFPGILTDTVPSYHQVTLFFRRKVSFEKDRVWIEDVLKQMQSLKASIKEKVVTIPVLYGGDGGPDLGHVAKINGRSEQEVIDLHTAGSYTVYMLGFLPGFPYLGGLDEKLATPRKDSPRAHVPSGSVGIAGAQTGVYPLASPGGWQLIGRTPLELVNVNHRNPCLLKPGDQLRFVSISPAEFENYLKEGSVHADD